MMKIYSVITSLLVHVLLVDSEIFTLRKDTVWDCEYRGYVPGGKVTQVGKIEAPVAKLAKDATCTVLEKISKSSEVLSRIPWHEVMVIVAVFGSMAPHLGPALGVLAIATGFISGQRKTKPEDVLEACDNAIGELTMNINDKISRMKGYVDSRIIEVQKDLIQREYQTSFNFWRMCVREGSAELSVECQRDAYHRLAASRPKFAIFLNKLKSNSPLTGFEARELEAYLVPFRDYANLILMVLKPLVQTYVNDTSTIGRRYYKYYSTDIVNQAKFFTKYAQEAVKAILKAHRGTQNASVCPTTIDCGPMKEIREGRLIKRHTANKVMCNCVIDDGTKQTCKVFLTIRKDGKTPVDYDQHNYTNCHSDRCCAKSFTRETLVPEAQTYQRRNVEIAQAYWEVQLLDFIQVWEKVHGIVHPRMKDASSDPLSFVSADKSQFSPRYMGRLRAAQEIVKAWKLQTKER